MAKHPRKRHKMHKGKPGPLALDPEKFLQAVYRADEAAATQNPLLHGQSTSTLEDKEEEPGIPSDDPLMRAVLVLQEYFPRERQLFSALTRYHALEVLYGHPSLSQWIKPVGEGSWEIANAVLYVAATAPLDAKGNFLIKPFCEALERWVKEHPA